MTLQSSGAISLSDIQTEFGGSNPIGLNEYYAGGSYVPSGTVGVPTSGAITIGAFYGKSKATGTWVLEQNITNGSYGEYVYAVARTQDYGAGTTYVLGRNTNNSTYPLWVQTINTYGVVTSSFSMDQPNGKIAYGDYAGYIMVGGNYTSGSDTGAGTVKFINGAASWTVLLKNLTFQDFNYSYDGLFITGYVADTSKLYGSYSPVIAKYNSGGSLQFIKKFTFGSISKSSKFGAISNEGLVFSGNDDFLGNTNSEKGILVKLNPSNGAVLWARSLTSPSGANYVSVTTFTNYNHYVLLAYSSSAGERIFAYYNNSGVLQWQKLLSGVGGHTILGNTSGTQYVYIISGMTITTGTYRSGIHIAKYNGGGTLQWQRQIKHSTYNLASDYSAGSAAVLVDSFNSLVIAAMVSAAYPGTVQNSVTIKIPADGSKTGTYTVNGYTYTYEASSALTESTGSWTDADYSSSLTIVDNPSEVPNVSSPTAPSISTLTPYATYRAYA